MIQRTQNTLILLVFLIGHLAPFTGLAASPSVSREPNAPLPFGIQVFQTDQSGLTLHLDTPDYVLAPVTYDGQVYNSLSFPGSEQGSAPGSPQLPFLSGLIGVPPGAEVALQFAAADTKPLSGEFLLPPGPRLIPAEEDFETGTELYEPDPAIYALDQWLPAEPVQLAEDAWLREQRVMRVNFFPFQYNPAQRALRWHPQLQATITFAGGQKSPALSISPFEDIFAQSLLNYESARSFRTSALIPEAPSTTYTSLGPRFDITVNQDGIYRVTYEALQAAGMDVDNINPATFHLYNQGQEVAIYVFGESDGFDPGDYLTFYGEKFRGDIFAERYQAAMNPGSGQAANNWFWLCVPDTCDLAGAFEQYTDDNVYSLTVGGAPGPRMSTVDGTPTGGTIPSVYTTTIRAEQSNYWWAYEFQSEDVWFWSQITRQTSTLPYTTDYSIDLPNVAPDYPATLHAEVASRNSTSGYPDHHTQFSLNAGPVLNDAYWDGTVRYQFTASVPAGNLLEGTNTLSFTMLPDVSAGTTRMYFDFFEITYPRLFVALADRLAFTRHAPGTWKYEIDGFTSSSVEVYNITNPVAPVRVLNPGVSGTNPYSASFRVTEGDRASYFVTGTNSWLSPANILQYQPPNFVTMAEADYLLITHENFIPSLQPLAAYRALQGLSVAIVDVDDLYREFNDGIYHPIAIKNFLAYTFANWEHPPLYVTLVGSGHWNFKNYGAVTEPYKNPPPVYMPPNLAYIDPWQGQTDSANLLATLVGTDTLPDLLISRLPVSSAAELDVVVGKIMSYEAQPVADWQRNFTFVADNIPDAAGDFVQFSEGMIADYVDPDPYYQPIRIFENDFGCTAANTAACDAVTQSIVDTLNMTGTLLLSYTGHGSLNRWSGESVFLNADVASLTNANQLPVVLSMTCLDGYWLYPNIDSLAKVFLTSAGKGAVAAYSPTGLGVATGHDDLQRGFFDALFLDGQWELGKAALQSKIRLFAGGGNSDLMHTFTVFGDPALHFPTPYEASLTPETDAQAAFAGETVTYTLEISNPGVVTDTYTVTLAGNAWDTTLSTLVTGPLAPDQSETLTVSVTIPPTALGNQGDTSTIQAFSQGDKYKSATSTLITTALTEGLELTPFSQSAVGPPGTSVTYTFSLTNTSFVTDVFTLSLSGNVWETNQSTPSVELTPGAGGTFQVTVDLPAEALGNDFDQVGVTVQSTQDPSHSAFATATTTAVTTGFTLTPAQASASGFRGLTATYTLQVTNLYNTAEYYAITLSGQTWDTSAPLTLGPVNPGETGSFLVNVAVPVSATVGMTDTMTVTVALLDEPTLQATSALTTLSAGAAFSLTPSQASQETFAGQEVSYAFHVTNWLNITATYSVTLSGQTWTSTAPIMLGPLPAGASEPITVTVTVPLTTPVGMTDSVTVTVALANAPHVQATSTLTTYGLELPNTGTIYIPIIQRP